MIRFSLSLFLTAVVLSTGFGCSKTPAAPRPPDIVGEWIQTNEFLGAVDKTAAEKLLPRSPHLLRLSMAADRTFTLGFCDASGKRANEKQVIEGKWVYDGGPVKFEVGTNTFEPRLRPFTPLSSYGPRAPEEGGPSVLILPISVEAGDTVQFKRVGG